MKNHEWRSPICTTCGLSKRPIGSRGLDLHPDLCFVECPGYEQDPTPGTLLDLERDRDRINVDKFLYEEWAKMINIKHQRRQEALNG